MLRGKHKITDKNAFKLKNFLFFNYKLMSFINRDECCSI